MELEGKKRAKGGHSTSTNQCSSMAGGGGGCPHGPLLGVACVGEGGQQNALAKPRKEEERGEGGPSPTHNQQPVQNLGGEGGGGGKNKQTLNQTQTDNKQKAEG